MGNFKHHETAPVSELSPVQKSRYFALLERVKLLNINQHRAKPSPSWEVYYGGSLDEARKSAREAKHADETTLDARVNSKLEGAEHAEVNVALFSRHDAGWNNERSAQRVFAQDVARKTLQSLGFERVIDDVCRVVALAARFSIVRDEKFQNKERLTGFVDECMNALEAGYVPLYDVGDKLVVYAVSSITKTFTEPLRD